MEKVIRTRRDGWPPCADNPDCMADPGTRGSDGRCPWHLADLGYDVLVQVEDRVDGIAVYTPGTTRRAPFEGRRLL